MPRLDVVGVSVSDMEKAIEFSFDPAWSPPTGGRRVGMSFLCESPEDVDRMYDELRGADTRRPGTRSGVSAMPSSPTRTAT